MRNFARALIVVCLAVPALAPAALAQHERHGPWRGDIHQFRGQDFNRWRGGRWFHGAHGGRDGWWWLVGSAWYFYPAPVYPYPNPYVPPVADMPLPPPPAAPQSWYYCANPQGYYPYVPQCSVQWQSVPAR